MIVCLCKGLSERALQEVIGEGRCTVEAVGRACGGGTDCGSCQGAIGELIHEARLLACAREAVAETGRQLRDVGAPSSPSREAGHEGQRPSH